MQREVDADFARYARARQHRMLRAAYLVCGDPARAQEVLEGALATVAGRWQRVREDPDPALRRQLYADAVSSVRGDQDGGQGALAELAPADRALLVLRYFEERSEPQVAEALDLSVPDAARQTRAAVARLQALHPALDVTQLLDDASRHVEEVDLAEPAWVTALARRRRSRRLFASAVGALGALVAVVAVAQGAQQPGPDPLPSPTTTSAPAVQRLPDGTLYAAMPLEGEEDRLPDYDAGLPSVIDPEARAVRLSTLPAPPASVVAVYLRRSGAHFRAVLVPKDRTQVVVDTLDLLPLRTGDGGTRTPLAAKAISAEGRYVVFAQPGSVVRLDLGTGAIDRYAVPVADLQSVAWGERRTVVARTARQAWTLDLAEASPHAVPSALPPAPTAGIEVPVTELAGDPVAAGRWVASGAYFDQDVTSPVIVRGNGPIYQGLVAVDTQARSGRVLLAPESPDGRTGRVKECCTVLSWADPSTVLFRANGYDGSWLLAWNVETGRVYDVAQLDQGGGVDYPRALALAVGSRG